MLRSDDGGRLDRLSDNNLVEKGQNRSPREQQTCAAEMGSSASVELADDAAAAPPNATDDGALVSAAANEVRSERRALRTRQGETETAERVRDDVQVDAFAFAAIAAALHA